MGSINELILKLRGEMSTRMDDSDIIEILEVLQEADEEIERLNNELVEVNEDRHTWRENSLNWKGEDEEDEDLLG